MLCKNTLNLGKKKFRLLILSKVILIILLNRGVRPFGVSLLIAGWDEDENCPYLYQCDPSVCQKRFFFCIKIKFRLFFWIYFNKGAYFAWKATAIGKNHINGKTFLEKR